MIELCSTLFFPMCPFVSPLKKLENLWFSGDQNEKLGRKLQREKCPNTEFFSGPYLDTFHAVNG